MDAQELRIGNWVCCPEHNNKLVRVIALSADGSDIGFTNVTKSAICDMGTPLQFEPISLTEEILMKAGFSPNGINVIGTQDKGDGRVSELQLDFDSDATEICLTTNDERYDDELTDCVYFKIDHCKHVHQLQNLYFALTGKELEIEL